MKKIFTLIASVAMALGANAQLITFGTKDAPATLQTTYEADGFKLTRTDTDGKHAIDANNATFGTAAAPVKFETRLKMGGKSSAKNALSVTAPSAGTLKVYVRTGSNSATDRNIVLTQNGAKLYDKVVQESDVTETIDNGDGTSTNVYPVIEVSVVAGDIAIEYPVNGLNFYGFEFVAGEGGGDTPTPTPTGNGGLISFGTKDAPAALAASYEVDGFILARTDTDGKHAIDANNATFGTAAAPVKFETRLKMGGKSSSKNGLTLTTPGAGTLKVYVRTGSNSATDRNIVLTQNGTKLYDKVVQESDVTETIDNGDGTSTNVYPVIEVAVAAGTVTVEYPVNGLNFYGFEFVSTTGISTVISAKNVNANAPIYNLAGQQVSKNYKGVVIQNGVKRIQK